MLLRSEGEERGGGRFKHKDEMLRADWSEVTPAHIFCSLLSAFFKVCHLSSLCSEMMIIVVLLLPFD